MSAQHEQETRAALAAELSRLEHADPLSVLALESSADDAQIRRAYLRAVKRWHPSRFARHSPEVRQLATEVFVRVRAAYDQLCGVAPRAEASGSPEPAESAPAQPRRPEPEVEPEPSEHGSRPSLQRVPRRVRRQASRKPGGTDVEVFERGRALLRQKHYHAAREEFATLVERAPTETRYRVHMHYAWAREYQEEGRSDAARQELENALELDPAFAKAKQALEALSGGKAKGRSLLSRLFRK